VINSGTSGLEAQFQQLQVDGNDNELDVNGTGQQVITMSTLLL
jgi:hypothetical protein